MPSNLPYCPKVSKDVDRHTLESLILSTIKRKQTVTIATTEISQDIKIY